MLQNRVMTKGKLSKSQSIDPKNHVVKHMMTQNSMAMSMSLKKTKHNDASRIHDKAKVDCSHKRGNADHCDKFDVEFGEEYLYSSTSSDPEGDIPNEEDD